MKYLILAVVMFIGCETIPTSRADDPHRERMETVVITNNHTVEKAMIGTALSLSVAAQQYDFNSNKRQWSIGAGRFDGSNALSIGVGGTRDIDKSRVLVNGSVGIEQGRVGMSVGINGRF